MFIKASIQGTSQLQEKQDSPPPCSLALAPRLTHQQFIKLN